MRDISDIVASVARVAKVPGEKQKNSMSNISGTIAAIRTIMWQDTGLNGDAQRIEQLGWMLFLKIFSDKDLEMELMDSKYKSPIPPEFHWVKDTLQVKEVVTV